MTEGYLVIFEKTETGFSAYVPDLPGCVTTGQTLAEAKFNMAEAIAGHLAVMREFGDIIPPPSAVAERLQVLAA